MDAPDAIHGSQSFSKSRIDACAERIVIMESDTSLPPVTFCCLLSASSS